MEFYVIPLLCVGLRIQASLISEFGICRGQQVLFHVCEQLLVTPAVK